MTQTVFDFGAVLEDAKNIWDSVKPGPDCPLDEVLLDYVYDDLTEQERHNISAHMAHCEHCRVKILKMETDRTEWEYSFNEDPDAVFADIAGESEVKNLKLAKKTLDIPTISKIRESLISWLSELWIPQWAGQLDLVSAADIPAQEHPFKTEDGEVRVRCYWKQKRGNKPAFIHVSWTVNITTDHEIRLFFVNPETDPPEIRYEAGLGTVRIGEKTFADNELGFDPSAERWGIAVAQIQ